MCGDNVHLNSIPYIIHAFITIFITGNNLSEALRIVFAKTICRNCTIKNARKKKQRTLGAFYLMTRVHTSIILAFFISMSNKDKTTFRLCQQIESIPNHRHFYR